MKKFEIYFTSDTHGKVLPVDYATGNEKPCGLLNIAAELKKRGIVSSVNKENDQNTLKDRSILSDIEANLRFLSDVYVEKESDTLVLDGGDSLQGTPMITYYLDHASDFDFHPVAEAFNAMGLDFYTLGNHDFNFGYDAIRDYVNAMKGTLLIANVEDLRGEIKHKRYVICTLKNGLKVGITGIVTDYVNVWEQPAHLTELRVLDAFKSADKVYKEMMDKGCDITVCIYHGGYEEDLNTHEKLTDSRENVACEIARNLSYDILLTGHQHMPVSGIDLSDTWSVQPPANAEQYISLRAEYTEGEKLKCTSELVNVGNETVESVKQMVMPVEYRTNEWLDKPVGEFDEEIVPESKLSVALYGSKVAALFNQVQLESVDADFSCTSLGNQETGFKKKVSIRDVYAAYTFANTSVVKEVTAEIIKGALERCAEYLELDENGKPYISDVFMKPKIEHYNYDFYAGLDYAFDLRRPVGDRVVRMRKLDGSELVSGEKYRLVTSNYRSTGTGGYEMIGKAKTVYSGADNVQDLLVDYIRKHPKLSIPDNYRFEIIF
ncbi:bifunctional metallophosphatase/5'-nucleotidase [Oribacterium sp. WCC10]|uniref:bifunctional metallophosphatase/5'-nucleotidase n=1 Tax=Oribacterium sp. WCC10 TaxID=1855343 RepID=UPI0008E83117|nr:bifunctional UDP-sugar hydrolase/5'-nucleotidase [Oribacterium sp. WCC10]SFG13353.1 2',3'-cyclic-nucleotide 2'-phosphodiesterase / 3'-nucleotidase [Oribacterium sp. WCC10]